MLGGGEEPLGVGERCYQDIAGPRGVTCRSRTASAVDVLCEPPDLRRAINIPAVAS